MYRHLLINITEWGPQTEDALRSREARMFNSIGLTEIHKAEKDIAVLKAKLGELGFHSFIAPSTRSNRSETGTMGGALTETRKKISIDHLAAGDDPVKPRATGNDWAAVIVNLRSMPLLLITVYLTSNVGLEAANVRKLAQIEALIQELGIFYCIGGDWNMQPEEIAESNWVSRINGSIVTPEGVQSTCSNGGRMLDYVIASGPIAGIIRLLPLPGAPWGTHLATMMVIPRAPRRVHVRTLVRPQALPENKNEGPTMAWREAKRWAQCTTAKSQPTPEIVTTSYIADREKDFMAGVEEYQRWSLAAEYFLLSEGATPTGRWNRHVGRGTWPQFHEVPVANKIPRHTANLADPIARLFASIHGNLRMLKCLTAKGAGLRQVEQILHYLTKVAMNDVLTTAAKCDGDEDKFDFITMSAYLVNVDRSPNDGEIMTGAIQLAAKLTARHRARAAAARRRSFRSWCDGAARGGAAQAHAYIRMPDQPPAPAELINDTRGIAKHPNHSMQLRRDVWQGWWNRRKTTTRSQEVQRAMDKLLRIARKRIKDDPHEPIEEEQVTRALNSLKKNRAKGIDDWAPGEWRRLPTEAKDELAQQLNRAERRLAMPMQVLLNTVSLLGKSETDDRPVSVTALIYAVYAAVRKCHTTKWDRSHAAFWDSAIKGSSPLRAAILRRLTAEMAVDAGDEIIETYLDIKNFMISLTR